MRQMKQIYIYIKKGEFQVSDSSLTGNTYETGKITQGTVDPQWKEQVREQGPGVGGKTEGYLIAHVLLTCNHIPGRLRMREK